MRAKANPDPLVLDYIRKAGDKHLTYRIQAFRNGGFYEGRIHFWVDFGNDWRGCDLPCVALQSLELLELESLEPLSLDELESA